LRKRVGIALVDQAVLSLFNLGLNLLLIRVAAPAEFGRFIFAVAVLLILTSLQNALVSTPLAVMVPGQPVTTQSETLKIIVSFDYVFKLAAAITAPVLCLLTDHSATFLAAVAVATFTTLSRECARSLALAFEQTTECLRIDITAIVVSLGGLAAFWWVLPPAVAALVAISLGNVVAVLTQVTSRVAGRLGVRETIDAYATKCWRDTKWSLIGAGTTEIQYRSYVFALEVFRDAATLASVQAGRLLLGPLPLVVGSWGRVARPAMARQLAQGDQRGMIRLTVQGLIYVLAIGALYCAALYAAWSLAEAWFFRGRYPDVGLMTLAWSLYMMTVIAHMVLSVPLQAAMRLKDLAKVTIATAVLSCGLMLGLFFPIAPVYAVVALTVGEIVALIWIAALVVQLARSSRLSPGPATPVGAR
jgi:O-antigen/teichoic acid export membrane protein